MNICEVMTTNLHKNDQCGIVFQINGVFTKMAFVENVNGVSQLHTCFT